MSSKVSRVPKPSTNESISRADANDQKVRQLIADLRNKKYKHVVFMVGAGISTEAGIPDFRSPKTGLYANLQRFKLPYPEAVFDIDYLRENPQPFFMLAKEMFPTQFEPTSFHLFMKWVADLGVLKRVYTQNIDCLERRAGIPAELIVEAHGSFNGNHCIDCKTEIVEDERHLEIEQQILSGEMPECTECSGIVKPNIVFFGESLPHRFFEMLESDFEDHNDVDLVIVAGTSLQVSPFNQLPDMVGPKVPRYLFNLEQVGSLGERKHDVLVLGSFVDLQLDFKRDLVAAQAKPTKESEPEKESDKASESGKKQPEGKLPEGKRSEGKLPEKIEPENAEPGNAEPENAKLENAKPETTTPENAKPETTTPKESTDLADLVDKLNL